MNNDEKLQSALAGLGYYRGPIDGNSNSFDTRNAIMAMNRAMGRGGTIFLDTQTRETLIYMSELYRFDKNLRLQSDSEEAQAARIQTALKISGFYHEKIDGAMGPGTRERIREYRQAKGLGDGDTLSDEERQQLVQSAIESNTRLIEEVKAGLRLGKADKDTNTATPTSMQATMGSVDQPGNNPPPDQTEPLGERIKKSSKLEFSDSFE